MYYLLRETWFTEPSGMLIVSIILFFVGLKLASKRPGVRPLGSLVALLAATVLVAEHFLWGPFEPQMKLARVIFLSLLSAWVILGPALIALFILSYFWQYLIAPITRTLSGTVRSISTTASRRSDARRRRRLEEEQRAEDERLRPERERLQRETASKVQEQARRDAEGRDTRLEARARCEFFYSRHCPELSERLSHEVFNDLLNRYLGDHVPPEKVDSKASQLLQLLQDHVAKLGEQFEHEGLAGLIRWFNKEKQKIEELQLPPDDEEMIIGSLESRFARLQEELIREMKP